MHLGRAVDRTLGRDARTAAMARARAAGPDDPCPLSEEGRCVLFDARPLACRLADLEPGTADSAGAAGLAARVRAVSGDLAGLLAGSRSPVRTPDFSLAEAVSGRYVQVMFELLLEHDPDGPEH
jgi:hypothetical protein